MAQYAVEMPGAVEDLTETVWEGFMFLDGVYLAPPYKVRWDGDTVSINGKPIRSTITPPLDERRGRRWRGPAPPPPPFSPAGRVHSLLKDRGLLIAFPDQPLVTVPFSYEGCQLLKVLINKDAGRKTPDRILHDLPSGLDRTVWHRWIESFTPTREFTGRAQELVDKVERTVAENMATNAANLRLHRFSFPLVMSGLVLSLVAISHLLSNHLAAAAARDAAIPSPAQFAARSTLLSAGMSAVDIAWSFLSGHNQSSPYFHGIETPWLGDSERGLLVKSAATLLVAGLFLALRSRSLAQRLSWWLCLLWILLTLRWLVANAAYLL